MAGNSTTTLPKSLFGFDVISLLGEGAASKIYAVSDPKTSQLYALKHVVKSTAKHQRYIEQLENELRVTEKFRHPGLRRCLEIKYRKNLLLQVAEAAMVMEMVDGSPLQYQPPKDVPEVVEIFIHVANALHALHYHQWVHCDLKPNNIMTDGAGSVKLIDFGQAAKVGTTKERVQGTPDFIAPEQVKLRPVTFRTDSFNFGATLYWALTRNRVPTLFTVSKSERDIVKESKFPTPRELNPLVPDALSKLVMDCVKMNPLHRPADMPEILHVLLQVREGMKGGDR